MGEARPGDMPAIVYIAGYGRSGSTLLERVLNSHERIFGAGELVRLARVLDDDRVLCACGQRPRECELWSGVAEDIGASGQLTPKAERVRAAFDSLLGLPLYVLWRRTRGARIYCNFNCKLLSAIARACPDIMYIVDSSKTAWANFLRPTALSQIAGMNVRLIHLVRDGRGCMWSVLRGSNRRMEEGGDPRNRLAAARAAVGWSSANVAAHLFQAIHARSKYCRIRYEDLAQNPARVLERLSRFLEIDLGEQTRMLVEEVAIPGSHQIAGNRLRLQERIVLKMDSEWEQRLKLRHRLLFWVFNWPLALWYGYT